MKQVTFSAVRVDYPRCRLVFDWRGTQLTKYVDISELLEAEFRAADRDTLKHLVAHIGMAYIPHLFALEDFDVVNVRPLALSCDGIEFYESYFQRGLAELRLRNGLDTGKRIKVKVQLGGPGYRAGRYTPGRSALLLNGGGKDTAVAGEILRNLGFLLYW